MLILVFVATARADGIVSFITVFLDSTGRYSFTYPAALPSKNALAELQKNFIKQKFGEKYLGQGPAAALNLYKDQNEELEYLSDAVSFPLPGIVQFVTSYYEQHNGVYGINGFNGSNTGIYTISDGKKIELASIFEKNWEKEVIKLIIKEFLFSQNLHSLADYDYTQKENDFFPVNAKISEYGGLDFVYPAYKIAPSSAGEQTIFLSWSSLQPYLNKKSVIYQRIKF